ncbi:MAG: flagellar hook-basal body complex protein, partial [Comamonas sp.]
IAAYTAKEYCSCRYVAGNPADYCLGYVKQYIPTSAFADHPQTRLVTASGLPVGGGITIPAGATSVSISAEGVVSALMPGNAAPQAVGNLAMASFINPAGLEPRGQNLYIETAASGQPQQGTPGLNGLGTVNQGYLEGSNVNVVQELVTMIQTQRAYEMNSKAIQTSDQMLAKLAQL